MKGYKMTNWENFIARRGINFEEFKKRNDINTKEQLIQFCVENKLIPPSELHLTSLFPVKNQEAGVFKNVDTQQQPTQEKHSNQKTKSKEKVNDVE